MFDFIDKFMEYVVLPFIVLVVGLLILGVVVVLPIAWWNDAHSPTCTLRKDQWACAASHKQTSTSYYRVGNVVVPQTTTEAVCDTYARGH